MRRMFTSTSSVIRVSIHRHVGDIDSPNYIASL